jgi:tripartite-type tricarboxylate transporter receptor subunit TctC
MLFRAGSCAFALVAAALLAAAPARADDVAGFYKGKTITVYNPFGEAGMYGTLVRLVADALPRHLPGGHNGIPQFMPGGGGLKQANYLYNVAPKDGTAIGLMYDNTPTAQVTRGGRGVKYDARKFGVLGSINKGEFAVLGTFKTTGIASFADAKAKQAALGATGVASAQYIVPLVMNRVLGTRFKLVPGYKSTAEIWLAMERGELTGIFTNYNTIAEARPQWISEKRFHWLAQLADKRSAQFPDLPLLQELASDPRDKAVFRFLSLSRIPGKILITPPAVPADRLTALRGAFAAMMKDAKFLDGLKKLRLEADPRTWQEAAQVIRETVETSPDVLARVDTLTRPEKK